MIHGDNDGVVLPPKIANIQVVIVPIISGENKDSVTDRSYEIKKILQESDIRCHVDGRDNHNPGFKFNHWELRGVPIRFEIGQREVENDEVCVSLRWKDDRKNKTIMKMQGLAEQVHACMEEIHHEMFNKAKKARDDNIKTVHNW